MLFLPKRLISDTIKQAICFLSMNPNACMCILSAIGQGKRKRSAYAQFGLYRNGAF